MITIYHLGVSQSDRIVWLMEELQLPYKLEWFDRGEDGMAPPEFLALHPAATAPIIKDGNLVLAESAAIVEYISQRYGNGRLSVAPDQDNYPDYLYWMQLNSNLLSCFFAKMAAGAEPDSESAMMKMVARREQGYLDFLEQRLGESEYLAGPEFSCTEIMAMFPLTSLVAFGALSVDDRPNLLAYIERVTAREAYVKAMAIAGIAAVRP